MLSNQWAATNRGNAFSVRRPAAAAASTIPPTTLIKMAMASHDRQRRKPSLEHQPDCSHSTSLPLS